MTAADTLLIRNAARAQTLGTGTLPLSPRLQTLILTCADHRVDPAHALGIDLGDAIVMRNLGGRVTTDIIRSLTVLGVIAAIEELSTDIELMIVQHTDCGMGRLGAPSNTPLVAEYLGVEASEVPSFHVDDAVQAVRADIDRLRDHPLIPGTLLVSGLLFDVATGEARILSPARRLDDS